MVYQRVSKPSSENSQIHQQGSPSTAHKILVQAQSVSASPQEQEMPSYTPIAAHWATNNNLMRSLSGSPVVQCQEESGEEEMEPIQAKLTIGQVGDKYEQEADETAQRVVDQINAPAPQPSSQGESLQREAMSEDEELQMKPEQGIIQREDIPQEEEELQMKSESGIIQREEMPEEEELQMQRQSNSNPMAATPDLEASIQQAKGSGQSLSNNIREPMEQAFGADFSGVSIHTNAQSDQMNQSIQAKAFTTGQDVFFRQGAYDPGSRGGQELIAHELTHVVQQNGKNAQISAAPDDSIQRVEETAKNFNPAEWLKQKPRPKDLKPFPDPRKQKRAKQPSNSEQDITSANLGRTKGMNEFLKALQNPETLTLKAYQELEQLTGKDALKQAGSLIGKGGFGTVFPYKKSGSSDTDPGTHVIKTENSEHYDRDYDERKAERKRAIYIPLVAHELGFTHMPLSTSMPQDSQVERQKKHNKILSTLAAGEDGQKKMRIANEEILNDKTRAWSPVDKELTEFVAKKTGKSTNQVSEKDKESFTKEFGFEEKLKETEDKFPKEERIKELDIDEQQIQDVVILDMLFQYQDGSYSQYMFDQGKLQKIDNDDYGIAKVNRNVTGEYSSSFPVGLPNANKFLTKETKKRILGMDENHLKKLLKAATYKDKSGINQKEKQQVFDEKKALRNLEDIKFLINAAENHGGISLREMFDLYNARDQDEVLAPESSQDKLKKYESKIKKQLEHKREVTPSQTYNILGVDFPENRKGLVGNYLESHEELGKIDKERQLELQKQRIEQGKTPSIKDNLDFIKEIEERSTKLRTERQEAVQKQKKNDKLKALKKLFHNLPRTLGKIEVVELLESAKQINDTDQIEGSDHIFSQFKNWKIRGIKRKVRQQIAIPMASNGSNNISKYLLDHAEAEISAINHDRIRNKAMYPVQVSRLKRLIENQKLSLERRTDLLNKHLDTIISSIHALDVVPLEEMKALRNIFSDVETKLKADIYALNHLIKQLETAVNNVLKHQEYAKVFGEINVFEEDIANLKNVIELYKKAAQRSWVS